MASKTPSITTSSPSSPSPAAKRKQKKTKTAKAAERALEQQDALRRASSAPIRDPITGKIVQLSEHELPDRPLAGRTPTLENEDDWIGDAPQLDVRPKEETSPHSSSRRRPPADSPHSSQFLHPTHDDDGFDNGHDFELATLPGSADSQKPGDQRTQPRDSAQSPRFLQAQHDDEDDELGSDQELAAIFDPPRQHEEEPLDRPNAPPPGTEISLEDRRSDGTFLPIASFEIYDSDDDGSSGYTTPSAGYHSPLQSVPLKGQTATQHATTDQHEDPATEFELGTGPFHLQDAGHFYTTAPPVVLETYPPATQTAQPRVDSPRGKPDSSIPLPQSPAVTAGLAVTAVPSANPPPAPPGRNKFFNLPIRWEKKVYYLTIDAPPNMTREQVIAIVTARLDKISAANDPAFHPGMAALDLTFDATTITAQAASAKLVFDSTTEPEVTFYTSAMQAGKMETLETLPEYTQTLERCRTEAVRVREPGRAELSSARVAESQPVRPTGPVRYIGFTNLGNTCYVNAALQAIAVNQRLRSYLLKPGALPDLPDNQENRALFPRYRIDPNQDGTYPHPLKLILTEYEARLRADHQYHGQPIHPGILIDYLRREGRISGQELQGDAHEAFLSLLLDANPNLEDSPIRAQETQTSVRAVPHLQSSDIHRMEPTRSQFPLIQLAAPAAAYPLQAHLSEHFTDSPRARGEASAPDKIHRGFAETPELLAVAVGRRNRNGTKNTTGITQPEQLALESGWARNATDIRFETDCFIYHYGTQGKGGHYVTIVKEADPDHAGQFRYVELSDSAPPSVITDFQRKEETASMIFYHRADASQAGSSQQGLRHAWRDPHSTVTIEQVDD